MSCGTPKTPGCPTASGYILQHASRHAFLAVLTLSPQCRGSNITSTELLREHRHTTAPWQTCLTIKALMYCLYKFKAQPYNEVACPNCIQTASNRMYFVRAAAVCTKRKICDLELSPSIVYQMQSDPQFFCGRWCISLTEPPREWLAAQFQFSSFVFVLEILCYTLQQRRGSRSRLKAQEYHKVSFPILYTAWTLCPL